MDVQSKRDILRTVEGHYWVLSARLAVCQKKKRWVQYDAEHWGVTVWHHWTGRVNEYMYKYVGQFHDRLSVFVKSSTQK